MKIQILGFSGSGKSTLAQFLAEKEQIPLLYLDTVQFTKNWQERAQTEKEAIVEAFLAQESWLIDGNYSNLFYERRLQEADQIIILRFSRWQALRRIVTRYFKYRGRTRPSMAAGNPEKLDGEFLWWVLYKGRTKKHYQNFEQIKQKYPEKVRIINNQKELDSFYQQYL